MLPLLDDTLNVTPSAKDTGTTAFVVAIIVAVPLAAELAAAGAVVSVKIWGSVVVLVKTKR